MYHENRLREFDEWIETSTQYTPKTLLTYKYAVRKLIKSGWTDSEILENSLRNYRPSTRTKYRRALQLWREFKDNNK